MTLVGEQHHAFWPRAILLVDMNAFFASVEQRDNPEWRGRPVAITNGEQGTCIITCSYEARLYGIKTGMRLKMAKSLCPDLIQCPSHPKRYAETSKSIMAALEKYISPDIEIYSVDEAFLDVSRCQKLLGTPLAISQLAKEVVHEASGLLCSIGTSGDKTTAKYAAKLHKPDGLTLIPPWKAQAQLAPVAVTELWGINKGIGNFLAQYGAYTCGDVARLPISILAKRFGNIGRRIWYQCQGMDPEGIQKHVKDPKSMGHGKVMPPNTTDKEMILTFFLHMCEKLAKRLRSNQMQAQWYFVGLRTPLGWFDGRYRTEQLTHQAKDIFFFCQDLMENEWSGQGAFQVQITALDPKPAYLQLELFNNIFEESLSAQEVIDDVNDRFGELTIAPARLLKRSQMPNVIAPSWKPSGHRQSI